MIVPVVEMEQNSTIFVNKYHDGELYLKIRICCDVQTAIIEHIEKIPNELSQSKLLLFTNDLLSRLKIKTATLTDTPMISYIGCDGNTEHIDVIDIIAIREET